MAEEKDPFAFLIELCQPTALQDAHFRKCRIAWESKINPIELSSSSDQTSSQPTGIVIVSPGGSEISSQQQAEDDDVVFHTPPEHHHHHSSSSEPNIDELCARALANYEGGDVRHRSEKARVSEVELGDEADSEKIRVRNEGFDGETVPVGETEQIVIETQVNNAVVHSVAEVIDLDSVDCGENTNDLGQKVGEMMNDGVATTRIEKPCENSYCNANLNTSKITRDEGTSKDNGGLKNEGKKIREIDEETSNDSVRRIRRKCQLPLSLDGKGKNVEEKGRNKSEKTESSKGRLSMDFANMVKDFVGDMEDGACEDIDFDFVETAKRRGSTFPRARWLDP